MAENGFKVYGVEPAKASLDIAKNKEHSHKIDWTCGEVSSLPSSLKVDLVTMTANVAQVFVTDESWDSVLNEIHKRLSSNGHFVFEVRDPSQKAWLDWNRDNTYSSLEIPKIGIVEEWCDLIDVSNELVSFRWTYKFKSDGSELTSDSTLRFRQKDNILSSLEKAGLEVYDIRDAPDRPKKEFVFIAKKLD